MGPTPEPERCSAILEVSGGQSATFEPVREISRQGKIVIKPSQKLSSNLTVYKVPKQDKCVFMAFCFELDQKKYLLGVERRKICFEIQAQFGSKDFSNKFLFRWATDKSQYGSLCSVAEPDQYLHVHEKEVIVNCKPDPCFKIKFIQQTTSNVMSFSLQNRTITEWLPCQTRMQCRRCLCSERPLNMNKKRPRKRKACFNCSYKVLCVR